MNFCVNICNLVLIFNFLAKYLKIHLIIFHKNWYLCNTIRFFFSIWWPFHEHQTKIFNLYINYIYFEYCLIIFVGNKVLTKSWSMYIFVFYLKNILTRNVKLCYIVEIKQCKTKKMFSLNYNMFVYQAN